MVQFNGGAKRTSRKSPLFLVPIELLRAVADTRLEGDSKYEPGNWMQGDTEFFLDCNSHAIEHLYAACDPDDPESIETHLGHAATNIAFMLWALRRKLICRADFRHFAAVLKTGASLSVPDGAMGSTAGRVRKRPAPRK